MRKFIILASLLMGSYIHAQIAYPQIYDYDCPSLWQLEKYDPEGYKESVDTGDTDPGYVEWCNDEKKGKNKKRKHKQTKECVNYCKLKKGIEELHPLEQQKLDYTVKAKYMELAYKCATSNASKECTGKPTGTTCAVKPLTYECTNK